MKNRFLRTRLKRFLEPDVFRKLFSMGPKLEAHEEVLHAFYDLSVSPATFNVVAFLVMAEMYRRKKNCRTLHVVIVPGPNNGFRKDNFATGYDLENMRWRLKNVLIPCCWTMPSCVDVTVFSTRREALQFQKEIARNIFPKNYRVRFPIAKYMDRDVVKDALKGVAVPSLQSTPQAVLFAKDWIKTHTHGRRVVSTTLRESSYEKDRNSSLEDWREFFRSLDPNIYCPVIIRDTEAALKGLPPQLEGFQIFREASWNVELRLAFYELSYLNMFVSNGPGHLLFYDQDTAYLFFKITSPLSGYTEELFYRQIGLKSGSQPPWATPFQRMVWKEDKADILIEEFNGMSAKIEGRTNRHSP